MAYFQDGRTQTNMVAVESKTKGMRVVLTPRGNAFSFSATSGLIAAAQAAGSTFFTMRLAPGWGYGAFIERMRIQYTTIGAYTTPITAGRRLAIYRGSAAAPSGGTGYTAPIQKDPSLALTSGFSTTPGGDIRMATTAGLGVTGITYETQQFREMTLTSVGTAGGTVENIFDFAPAVSSPLILSPGQLIAIRNPQAMDAAGTWQIQVDIDWHETVFWSSTSAD